MKGVREMEIRRNCNVSNCNIVAIETPDGFDVMAGGKTLLFRKVKMREYNIFQNGALAAIFNCYEWEHTVATPDGGSKKVVSLHIAVTNPEGKTMMLINSHQAERKSDEEYCKFVAELMSRWNEK